MDNRTLRFANAGDAAAIGAIYNPYVCKTAITFEYDAPSLDELRRRIAATMAGYPYLVCEVEGELIGFAYAGRFRERAAYHYDAETSLYVAEGWHGRGVGKALYLCLLDLLREQRFYNAYASIVVPNPKSFRLHEALGFTPIGVFPKAGYKFDRWHDLAWFGKGLLDHATPALPPRKPNEVDPDLVAACLAKYGG